MIILATKSLTRQNLLTNAGVEFRAEPSGIDESDEENAALDPQEIAERLSAIKAITVSKRFPLDIVLGCDQTMECNKKIMVKPNSRAEAEHQLNEIKGNHHYLHSALSIALNQKIIWRHTSTATLHVREFSTEFAKNYLDQIPLQVLTSIGCYQIEKTGIQLFDKIEGDYHTILGLPLLPLLNYLRKIEHIKT